MTPSEYELDRALLDKDVLTLYRLASARYANLSGAGAAISPGRWNSYRQPAIYTSIEVGTAVAERLVHTPKDTIPTNLALMSISFEKLSADLVHEVFGIFTTLANARANYPFRREYCAVAVPSVILPVWNVVLYPEHAAFWDVVSLKSVERFDYDPRLFPAAVPKPPI